MKKSFISLLLAVSAIIPLSIGTYIQRTMNGSSSFCTRFDTGRVEQTYLTREENVIPKLSRNQITKRVRYQLRGASFARFAAYKAGIKTCTNSNFIKFSRTRNS